MRAYITTFIRRLRSLGQKAEVKQEIDEELRFHIEQCTADNIAAGMAPAEAAREARRRFGNTQRIREECREAKGASLGEATLQDVRFGLRMLLKNPGFTVVAVLTLALGIGANTAIFTFVNALLLRPLPVDNPARLILLSSGGNESFSNVVYERLRDRAQSVSGLAAAQEGISKLEMVALDFGAREAEQVRLQLVSGNFFSVLGAPAVLGRTLGAEDDRAGKPQPVAVLSNAFWQRRFNGDAAVIGKTVRLERASVTIVGVMPPGFFGFELGADPDLWCPTQLVALTPALAGPANLGTKPLTDEGYSWLIMFGRLRPVIAREQAQTELATIFQQQRAERASGTAEWTKAERSKYLSETLQLIPGGAGYTRLRAQFGQPLFILTTVVGIVLLIACANVAGLQLARGAARQRELAVRTALGAGRLRLVRQLVTESLLLAIFGGVAGLILAHWGVDMLARYLPSSGSAVDLQPDEIVLGFTMLVTLTTGIGFGLLPALRLSRVDLVTAVKNQTGQTTGRSQSRLNQAFVVAQIALSVTLLAGAGLFVRTLHNLQTLDLGFERENILWWSLDFSRDGYNASQKVDVHRRLLAELEHLPGVRAVTLSGGGMLSGSGMKVDFGVEGYIPAPDEEMKAMVTVAGPRFFETLRIPLLFGRGFNSADERAIVNPADQDVLSVVILGEGMARKFFGNANPVGRHLLLDAKTGRQAEIVGVARDTRYRNLRENIPLEFYTPYFGGVTFMPMMFHLRAAGNPRALAADVQRIVQHTDPKVAVRDLTTMDDFIDGLMVRERVLAQAAGFFSAFALLLACLGLYGMLSYSITQRTREFGVRMALGATVGHVLGLVMRQGIGLALVGCGIGLIGALALTRLVESLLFGVGANDPLTFVATAGMLLAVAMVACWLPARRATKIDPLEALRYE